MAQPQAGSRDEEPRPGSLQFVQKKISEAASMTPGEHTEQGSERVIVTPIWKRMPLRRPKKGKPASSGTVARVLVTAFGLSFVLSVLPSMIPAGLIGSVDQAWAANECGVQVAGTTTITCPGGNYPSGISYVGGASGLTLVLNDPTITVTGQVSASPSTADVAINAINFGTITSTAAGGALWVDNGSASNVVVTMGGGTVNASGNASGIFARSFSTGSATAILTGGVVNVSTGHDDGFGGAAAGLAVWAWSSDTGSILAEMDGGTINATGVNSVGIFTVNTRFAGGTAATDSILMTGGTVNATGTSSIGIYSLSVGYPVKVEMTGGSVQATGVDAVGILAQEGTAAGAVYDLNITGGTVVGGSGLGAAIRVQSSLGGTINLGSAATIDGTASGLAIDASDDGDTVVTTAATIKGNVVFGAGNDSFTMTGGQLIGALTMGAGDDTVNLVGLTDANLSGVTSIDGGSGNDTLNFSATSYTGGSNIVNWEQINLLNGSRLTLSGDLVLGDATTQTGTLSIDTTSTLSAGGAINPTIRAIDPTQPATVINAGTIDLRNSTALASNSLTIVGNYIGQGGTISFNTFLGSDNSPSDRLVINGGTATGSSFLHFTNADGPGALTTANGILVVDAVNGATTAASAFTMSNPELRAGAFDYRLFQGGPDGSDPNNWYLRSTFIGPTPGLLPIVGPELATYGVVQPMAQQLGRAMLGTHDERLGDLYQVPCEPAETNASSYTKAPVYTKAPTTDCVDGWRPAVWGRLFGQQIDNHYQALADPRADGQIAGFQAGVDVLRSDSLIPGHKDYAGFYAAYGNANVDVTGLVTNAAATAYVLQHTGSLNLNAYSGGAYWTHYGVPGWYVDLTLQGTSYTGGASTEFASLKTTGTGFISSLEAGYPIPLPMLGPSFVLEPQAQVLWQYVSFDSGNDGLGPVALGTNSETTARLGLKGKWTITTDSGQVWQPYVRANFWSDFGGNATTMFGVDGVPLISHAQYMDVDVGFTTKINAHLSAFTDAGYQFAVSHDGGGQRDGVKGTAGLRFQW